MATAAVRAPAAPSGLPQAIATFVTWGLMPLVFYMLRGVAAIDVVAWRLVWSLVLLVALLAWQGALGDPRRLMLSRAMLPLIASGLCTGISWIVYLWAATHGHLLAGSLGFFLSPLLSMALARVVLDERMNRLQTLAVALAAIGVALAALRAGDGLWISLVLAIVYALYGLIRKVAVTGPMLGVAAETAILLPLGLAWIGWRAGQGSIAMTQSPSVAALLLLMGVLTGVPMLLFVVAARRMRYSTLAVLQYIPPSMQFLLGLTFFGEPLSLVQFGSFALIWVAILLYCFGLAKARNDPPVIAPE